MLWPFSFHPVDSAWRKEAQSCAPYLGQDPTEIFGYNCILRKSRSA